MCKKLFVDHLGVEDASIEDFVDALIALDGHVKRVKEIKELLMVLSDEISRRRHESATATLLEIDGTFEIIPVDMGGLYSINSQWWFIADDLRLGRSFKKKVALLNFSSAEVERSRPFFEETKLDNRFLSSCVKTQMELKGSGKVNDDLTLELQAKADFIAWYACIIAHHLPIFGRRQTLANQVQLNGESKRRSQKQTSIL